jgi:Glycosyl transferase family 2
MSLTICVPVYHKHEMLFNQLANTITSQIKGRDVVIMKLLNRGEKTIGEYRQEMLDQTSTEYITFIDADDRIAPKYMDKVFEGIERGAKAIGFKGQITTNGRNPFTFIHSMRYKKWADVRNRGTVVYQRPLNHLNPIKTEIARQIGYGKLRHGEDLDYSMRLMQSGLVTQSEEHFIDEILYYYLYVPKNIKRR